MTRGFGRQVTAAQHSEFQPMRRGLFSHTRQPSERKRKDTSAASREGRSVLSNEKRPKMREEQRPWENHLASHLHLIKKHIVS